MSISRRNFVMGTTALALAAPATVGRAQSDAIKFASILDLSGGLDIYGAPMAETTKLAIEDINAAGGLLGAHRGSPKPLSPRADPVPDARSRDRC